MGQLTSDDQTAYETDDGGERDGFGGLTERNSADEDDGLETLTQDGYQGQDEERPFAAASLLALLFAEPLLRLLVERALELDLPLELGAVDAEHSDAHDLCEGESACVG